MPADHTTAAARTPYGLQHTVPLPASVEPLVPYAQRAVLRGETKRTLVAARTEAERAAADMHIYVLRFDIETHRDAARNARKSVSAGPT